MGNISLILSSENNSSWWELHDFSYDWRYSTLKYRANSSLEIVTFNDRIATGAISVIAKYGYTFI